MSTNVSQVPGRLVSHDELSREISQLVDRCASYELRQRERLNSVTHMFQELNLALNNVSLGRERDRRRIELLERRVAELEARTWPARRRRFIQWCRQLIAELGGSFVYEDDDDLDPQLLDDLRELYRAPGDFSRPPSLPLVRQDARHAR